MEHILFSIMVAVLMIAYNYADGTGDYIVIILLGISGVIGLILEMLRRWNGRNSNR